MMWGKKINSEHKWLNKSLIFLSKIPECCFSNVPLLTVGGCDKDITVL